MYNQENVNYATFEKLLTNVTFDILTEICNIDNVFDVDIPEANKNVQNESKDCFCDRIDIYYCQQIAVLIIFLFLFFIRFEKIRKMN